MLALAVTVVLAVGPAGAYQTFNDHKLTYGVAGQKYWLSASAVNNNKNAIVNGVGLWNATSTPISYSRTTTKSSSRMDFYNDGNAASPYCAYTAFYVGTTSVNPYNQNWWWSRVYTTPRLKQPAICGVAAHRKAVVAHEQGHVMGLDHANSAATLMYIDIAATNVNAPNGNDIAGINFLY